MKKELLFAAIAAVGLAACSSDDTLDANKSVYSITFRASVDKVTRASEITVSNMQSFNVTAVGNSQTYFSNLPASSSDNGTNWTTDNIYYWPSYELTFYAWSHASDGTVSVDEKGQKVTDFTPNKSAGLQKDFLVSCNKGNKKDNNGSGVTMNFKHALSQIAVQAKCSNSNIKVEVLGVKLVNVATKADFKFPTTETSTTTALAQSQWSNWSESGSYMVKGTKAVELNDKVQSILFSDESFMLIPQKLTAWNTTGESSSTGAYLAVLCRVSSLNSNNVATLLYPEPTTTDNKEGKYAFTAVAIDTNWEPGKKYTYTLDFCNGVDGGGGMIAADLTNPDDDKDNSVDTNPIAGATAGTTILGPIQFKATVENWDTSTSVNTNM